jgi:hypothetical protein
MNKKPDFTKKFFDVRYQRVEKQGVYHNRHIVRSWKWNTLK